MLKNPSRPTLFDPHPLGSPALQSCPGGGPGHRPAHPGYLYVHTGWQTGEWRQTLATALQAHRGRRWGVCALL